MMRLEALRSHATSASVVSGGGALSLAPGRALLAIPIDFGVFARATAIILAMVLACSLVLPVPARADTPPTQSDTIEIVLTRDASALGSSTEGEGDGGNGSNGGNGGTGAVTPGQTTVINNYIYRGTPGKTTTETVTKTTASKPVWPGAPEQLQPLLPRTGDAASWIPVSLVALAALGLMLLARRKMAPAAHAASHAAFGRRGRAARNAHGARSSHNPRHGAFSLILVGMLALGGVSLPAPQANAADAVQKVTFTAKANGSVDETQVVHLDNAATWWTHFSFLTVNGENGWAISRDAAAGGDISISIAPVNSSADAVDAANALDGVAVADTSAWRLAGTASSQDEGIDVAITVKARGVKAGSQTAAFMNWEQEAVPYDEATASVAYDGRLQIGTEVSASAASLPSDGKNSITWRWQSSDDGEEWTDVPGEVEQTLIPGVPLAFRYLRAVPVVDNPAWYKVEAKVSPATPQDVYAETATVAFADPKADAPDAQTVVIGGTAVDPVAPTATGYAFTGWYTAAGKKWRFGSDTVQNDLTLTARWSPNANTPYRVEHYLQNAEGTGYEADPIAVDRLTGETDSTLDASTLVHTYAGFAYADAAWENADASSPTVSAAGDTLGKLYYERQKFTVSFDANKPDTASGAVTDVPGSQDILYDATAAQPANPTLTGYVFGGWYKDAACEEPFSFGSDAVHGDITLYAKWTAGEAAFVVRHYQQPLTGTEWVLAETEQGVGVFDGQTTAAAKQYEGFTARAFDQVTISSTTASDNVVSIYYDRNTYTLELNANGHGDDYGSQDISFGVPIVPLPTPAETGFTFGGWFEDADCTRAWDGTTMPARNLALYAKWTVNIHTVSFEVAGRGTKPADQRVEYGAAVEQPTDPAEDGYTFEGWYDNTAFAGETYDFATPMPDADVTLYAKWSPRVSYLPGTDDVVTGMPEPAEFTAAVGATLQQPDTPARVGYSFAGWYDADGKKWNFNSPVAKNTVLTAKWTANRYTVTFGKGEGVVTGSTGDVLLSYDEERTLSANGYKRAGYVFDHWEDADGNRYSDKQKVKNLAAENNAIVELTAVWAEGKATYKVEHYQQNLNAAGTDVVDAYTLADTDELEADTGAPVTAEGKIYEGFTLNGSAPDQATSGVVAGDGGLVLKLYYDRDACTYTVKHLQQDLNADGTAAGETYTEVEADVQELSGPYGAWTQAETKTYTGFKAPAVAQQRIAADGATVVELKYERLAYTISYAANGGSGAPASQTKAYGATVEIPTVAPTHADGEAVHTVTYNTVGGAVSATDANTKSSSTVTYAFMGWNTEEDGTGTNYAAGSSFLAEADVILTAQWNPTAGEYSSVTLPKATKSGQFIEGWYTQENGGEKVGQKGEDYMPSDDVTLYAHWRGYLLKFEAAGTASGVTGYVGAGTMGAQEVVPSSGYTVDTCSFAAPEGTGLAAWNTRADGTGRWVLPGEVIAANDTSMVFDEDGICTLYAQWSHFAGMNASEVKTAAYNADTASEACNLGDIWVSGELVNSGATKAVDKVMICRLIGIDSGTKTFMTVRALPKGYLINTDQKSGSWFRWRLRATVNSGAAYQMMPTEIVSNVASATKTNATGTGSFTTTSDKFWPIAHSELTGATTYGNEGSQYAYFGEKGVTEMDLRGVLVNSGKTNSLGVPVGAEGNYYTGGMTSGYCIMRTQYLFSNGNYVGRGWRDDELCEYALQRYCCLLPCFCL